MNEVERLELTDSIAAFLVAHRASFEAGQDLLWHLRSGLVEGTIDLDRGEWEQIVVGMLRADDIVRETLLRVAERN